jgi:rhodanese-related sulfurtransferase
MSSTDESLKAEATAMMKGYTSKFQRLPVITSEEINNALVKGEEIVLVDVRECEELEVSMIPTAITKEEFLLRKDQLSKKTLIVPYCTIGHRSGVFGTTLLDEGFENVYNGEGIILWSHLPNAKLVTGVEVVPTRRVHTFGHQWDKVPQHMEAVQFGYWSMAKAFIAHIFKP